MTSLPSFELTNFANAILNDFEVLAEYQTLEFISSDLLGVEEDELPANAMPDFIGGFMFAITTDEEVKELEGCYAPLSPDRLQAEVKTAINLMSKKTFMSELAAAPFFLGFIATFPKTLTSCKMANLPADELEVLKTLAVL